MKIYKTQKSVLSFTNNPESFLNGISSNTLDAPNNAFLNIHGRIVATFDQLCLSEQEYWICVESQFLDQVFEHIDRYLQLSCVEVEKKEMNVYFDLNDEFKTEHSIAQKKGKLVITEKELEVNVSDDEFTLFRLQNSIPLHGVDYTDEMLLNVSTEEFVSFTKGCFLGQEPIAKVYNRSKPTWKLIAKYEDECNDEEKEKMTSKINDNGRTLGFVFEKNA